MSRRAAILALSALVGTAGCTRLPPPNTESSGSGAGTGTTTETRNPEEAGRAPTAELPEEGAAEVEELREIGPTYIPFDEAPQTIWDTETQAVLSKRLLPILREEELPAATRTVYWLLVGPDGRVADMVVHTASGNAAFDAAGAEVAKELRFRPALRGGRPVAVWILKEISLLMQ